MDELLLRQMPHSTEAEQAVLGSMLIDAACVKDVMDQLQPDDFYLRQNREIFETIYTMFVYSRPIDGLTVAGELEKAGLANDGTRAYLAQLMEVTPTSANVLEYVRLVREKALLRSVATAAAEITAMVQEGTGAPGDVLELCRPELTELSGGEPEGGWLHFAYDFARRQLFPEKEAPAAYDAGAVFSCHFYRCFLPPSGRSCPLTRHGISTFYRRQRRRIAPAAPAIDRCCGSGSGSTSMR